MPKLYRSMKRTADGIPVVGSQPKELGVREPPSVNADVDVDDRIHVILNGKGMSVAENWRRLLPHLIPKRLKEQGLSADASGSNALACWTMGNGPFAAGAIDETLCLALKPGNLHSGNIAPIASIPLREFQDLLAATRPLWVVDET